MASLSKSKKNSKSVNTATDTSSNKSLEGNGQASICPICCDVIVDATAGEDGHDSIFCDDACNGWVHRRCAGLPKAAFQAICDATTANQLFYSPNCRLDSQEKVITTLKQAIDLLSQETARLKRIVCQPDTASTTVQLSPATVTAPHIPPPQPQTSQHNLPRATRNCASNATRKFKVVIRGIQECPHGMPPHDRAISDDSQYLLSSKILPSLAKISVRDCRRLGKYSETSLRPRLLLVTLTKSSEVYDILAKKYFLAKENIFFKPDLSPADRQVESILLKERRSLINTGTNSKSIKLRGDKLFIDDQAYGRVVDGVFTRNLSLSNSPSSTSQPV